MRDHERIEELIAVRALGGLDPQDDAGLREEMAGHGPDCAECRRLEADYDEVAGRLAFALTPERVPGWMEDDVVARTTQIAEPLRVMSPRGVRGARARRMNLRPLVAIAAAIVLFAGGLAVGGLLTGDGAVPAGARVVAFDGEGGRLSAAFEPGEPGLYLLGSSLERLPDGRVYELWMIEDGIPRPARCFTPSPDGSVFAFVDAEVGDAQLMAVTVEPQACSDRPTTEPFLTAELA